MSENKFWVNVWIIAGATLVIIVSVSVYSGHLDDQRDLEFGKIGMEKFRVPVIGSNTVSVEWHKSGWKQPDFNK